MSSNPALISDGPTGLPKAIDNNERQQLVFSRMFGDYIPVNRQPSPAGSSKEQASNGAAPEAAQPSSNSIKMSYTFNVESIDVVKLQRCLRGMPTPESPPIALHWFYVDSNATTQGPFLGEEILRWFLEGQIPSDLLLGQVPLGHPPPPDEFFQPLELWLLTFELDGGFPQSFWVQSG